MGAKTQWERDYIDALVLFYRDYDKLDYEKRVEAYSRAIARVYEQYPKDQQAAVFYALSLLTWSVDRDPLANPKKRSRSSIRCLKKIPTILEPPTT